METELENILNAIQPPDRDAMDRALTRQAQLAKPPGSLGKLEDISVRLAGVTGKLHNEIDRRRILVFCADNGVTAEGVSCAPQSVTAAQAVNMTKHLTGMSAMAKHFGCEVVVSDVGIATPYHCPDVRDYNIAKGTKNFAKEPAMTRAQTVRAIMLGASLADEAARDGVSVLGIGEMGIGNTTTSSAVLAALTGLSVEAVTGRGGGVTDEGFLKKKRVIESALALHRPDENDPVDVLTKVGGLDLAAMCGAFLGAAANRIPVVIDGFISVVAALCAARLAPDAKSCFFPSHCSYEIGYRRASDELELDPWLDLGMRLGEGSGCPLAFEVLDAACAVMNGMATFDGAAIDDGYLEEIRGKDSFSV